VVLVAYETLARIAFAQDDERRGIAILETLQTLGRDRRMPRFIFVSLAMRIDLHSCKGRAETAAKLMEELDALAPVFEYPEYQPFLAEYRLRRAMARALLALARFDPATADVELASAAEIASGTHWDREALTVQVLRAVALRDLGSGRAMPLLREALSLAAVRGCLRVADDAHPGAVSMRDELRARDATKPMGSPTQPLVRPSAQRAAATAAAGLLTPKEAEVLRLLAAGHSNKHIAKAMDISDETVKWHLKNLFSKLSAGTRRHAVDRARMMGLVFEESSVV
jgi:LuxR family maltose regulon positive regulatory protein